MAKLTAEERAELEARLREDDDDDEDDEVEIGKSDGSYYKGSLRRARHLGYAPPKDTSKDKGGAAAGKTGEAPKRFNAGRRTG